MSNSVESVIFRILRDNPEIGEIRLCAFGPGPRNIYARALPSESFAVECVRRAGPPVGNVVAMIDFNEAVARRKAEQVAVGVGADVASALRSLVVALSQHRARGGFA